MNSRMLMVLVLLIDLIECRIQLQLITDHPIAFKSIDFQLLSSSSNDTINNHYLYLYNDEHDTLIDRYSLSNISSSLITFPCHCFLIGNVNYSIRFDHNVTLIIFFVDHPSSPIRLSMPNSTRSSQDVLMNITDDNQCTTVDYRLVLRMQHSIDKSMIQWIELATLKFFINTTSHRWSCALFADSDAIYETQLMTGTMVISSSNQMIVFDDDDDTSSYRLTMRSDSIYPHCGRDLLIGVDRQCIVEHDRVRLFAVTASFGSQQLLYIGERRISSDPHTIVTFSCALFDIIYPAFCFELVSVLPQSSVVIHRVQQCVATEPPSHATIDGVWSSWSAWSKCADLPSRCSHRRRFRTCTNPPPKHGGKFCTGRAIQIDKCNGNYSCATTTLINQTTTRRPLLASIEQCACGCRLGALVIESGRCTNVSIWLIDPLRSQSSTRRLHLHVIDDRLTMEDRLIIYNSRNRMIYDSQQSSSNKDIDCSIDDEIEGDGAAAVIIYYPSSSNWIASDNWHNAIVEYRWNIDDEYIDHNTTTTSSSSPWKWWSSTASSRPLLTMIALLSPAAMLLVVPPFLFIFIIQRRFRQQQQQLHRPAAAAPIVAKEEEREGLITADDIMTASHQTQSTRLSGLSSQLHTVPNIDSTVPTIGRRSIGVQLSTISLAARGLSVQSTPSLPHHTRSSFQQKHRYSPRSTSRRCAPPFDDSTLSLGGTASEQDFEYDYYEPAAVPGSYLLPPSTANSFFTSQIDIDQIIGDNSMLMMDDDASSSINQRTIVSKKCYSVSTQIDDDK